jgi:glycosyltransferase involved in cell wall biosynthesis
MWNGKQISVILPTFNEKGSIRECIFNFQEIGIVDEIIVVNNNAVHGTSEEVKGTGAREVFEEKQGYGAAIRKGFREASGDYLIVCEPDGTFSEKDIYKLLAYSTDYEIVFGSRTVKEFIWSGANMGLLLRWGNYFVAKFLEFLFNTNSLSDVGCTYRLLSRKALEKMEPYFKVYDNYFGPEMILLAARISIPFIQIPINYKKRIGESAVTGHLDKAILLGLQMVFMIIRHRMEGTPVGRESPISIVTDMLNTNRYYLFYFFIALCSMFWLIKPLSEYLTSDASAFIILVYKALGLSNTPLIDLASGRDVWHPFLYQSILILTGKLFGTELVLLRMIGIFCLLLNLYLLRKICIIMVESPSDQRTMTFLTIAFFLLVPFTLEGAAHIDIDNTIMLPILLSFIYAFGRLQTKWGDLNVKALIILSFLMALALWAKLTTPIVIPVALGLYYAVKKNIIRSFTYPLGLLIICSGMFILSWLLFCAYFNLPFLSVFQRIFGVFFEKANETLITDPKQTLRYLAIITFWFNPLIIFSWLTVMLHTVHDIIKKKKINDTFLFISILTLLIGIPYLFIGQVTYGIPKYLYPLTGLVSIMLSYRLYKWFGQLTIRAFRWYILAALLIGLLYFIPNDPIYLLNYTLKIKVLYDLEYFSVLTDVCFITLLYILPLLAVVWFIIHKRREKAITIIFVFILAQTIGFNFKQSTADYQTTYNYGYRGVADVHVHLPQKGRLFFPEWAIIPPRGSMADYVLDNISKNVTFKEWQHYIITKKPDAVIYGPALNTLDQLKRLFMRSEFDLFMRKDYNLTKHGDYNLYLLKNAMHKDLSP